jgi:hypothetical protein
MTTTGRFDTEPSDTDIDKALVRLRRAAKDNAAGACTYALGWVAAQIDPIGSCDNERDADRIRHAQAMLRAHDRQVHL